MTGMFERPAFLTKERSESLRDIRLRELIDRFSTFPSVNARDRGTALEARFFLQSLLRDTQRSLSDIGVVFQKKVERPGISSELIQLLREAMSLQESRDRISHEAPPLPDATDDFVYGSGEEDEDEVPRETVARVAAHEKDSLPTSAWTAPAFGDRKGDTLSLTALEPILGVSFAGNDGADMGSYRERVERNEVERAEQARQQRERVVIRVFERAPENARRYVDRVLMNVDESKIPSVVENVIQAYVDEVAYLEEEFGFDVGVFREGPSETFLVEFSRAIEAAGDERAECLSKISNIIFLRAQIALLLRREAMVIERKENALALQPEAILGLAGYVREEDVEREYAVRLQMLDPDRPDDAAAIRELHHARIEMLLRVAHAGAMAVGTGRGAAQTELRGSVMDASPKWESGGVALGVEGHSGSETSLLTGEVPSLSDVDVFPVPEDGSLYSIPRSSTSLPQYEPQDAPWMSTPEEIGDEGPRALLVDLPALRRKQKLADAAALLGVSEDASDRAIESAFAGAVEMLDYDRAADRREISALIRAKETLLSRSMPPETVAVQKVAVDAGEKPQVESRVTKVLRAPGRALRTLFGVGALAGGAAGALAVHEFAENEINQPRIEVRAQGGVDPEKDLGISEGRPVEASVKTSEIKHVVANGDSVWKMVVQMLRDRKLSTSNAQTQYFTHQALVDNGLTALTAMELKPGDTVNLTNIGRMMDQMVLGVPLSVSDAPGEGAPEPVVSDPSKTQTPETPTASGEDVSKTGMFPGEAVGPAYAELPTADHTTHVMRKGEHPYKLVHTMLRSRGLNWTTERINFLTQLVVDQNADLFRVMVSEGSMKKMGEMWIPVGAKLDFSDAITVLDEMERAKKEGKKSKTVRQLAGERGYKYPLVMQFPKE